MQDLSVAGVAVVVDALGSGFWFAWVVLVGWNSVGRGVGRGRRVGSAEESFESSPHAHPCLRTLLKGFALVGSQVIKITPKQVKNKVKILVFIWLPIVI